MAIYSSLCTESLLSPSSYHSALLGGQLHDHMSLTSVIMSLHSGAAPGRAFSNSTKKSQWQNSEVPISLLVFFHSVLLMVPPTCAGNQMTEQERTQFGGRQRHPPNSWYLSFSKLDQAEVWDCSVLKAENVGCRKQARGGWRDHSLLLFGTLRVTKAWGPQEWLLLYSSDWGHAIQSYVLRPLDRCSDNPRVSRQSW